MCHALGREVEDLNLAAINFKNQVPSIFEKKEMEKTEVKDGEWLKIKSKLQNWKHNKYIRTPNQLKLETK